MSPKRRTRFPIPQRQPEKTKTVWRFHQTVFSRQSTFNLVKICGFQAAIPPQSSHQKSPHQK
ncbi:hypothetical protein HMPREF9123_0227 [Neisseria bacilliformis ATCC BAA-1200]|uniref:Uncharacterized protein n=1 Tax=Neisseria bacilliformis ATCC BAA-1200 TaxID=888742 RepID=F2B917_9NEIS|nr:hypothetical protein HMPREF9123_0227 [Neisseria bacilliformis ATCC BAA-1200]